MNSQDFRVTSISYCNRKFVIFSGVPLAANDYRINNGKFVVSVKSNKDLLPVEPAIGQHWHIEGDRKITDIDSNGFQLKQHTYDSPKTSQCTLPETGDQLIKFIAANKDFKGIGESKARELWSVLGDKIYTIATLRTSENQNLLSNILSETSIDALYEGFKKYTNLSACNWMAKHQIPSPIQQRIIRHHGSETIEAIRKNPYTLITFGMSFVNADEISSKYFKIKDGDPKRLTAAIEHVLRDQISKGHTFTTMPVLLSALKILLNDPELAKAAIFAGSDKCQYIYNPRTETYHPTALLLMEVVITKRLSALAKHIDLFDDAVDKAYQFAVAQLPYELTKEQCQAVANALDNGVSLITGGAGTGKTTVLLTVLRAFHQLGFSIHAVALSGRAAMRLHESVGFKTSTIAALLRKEPIEPSTNEAKHLLVVDEASMLDVPTMYRLVTHCHPSTRILLTGDPNQLPPIGAGKILADIVSSKSIINSELNIVKRQGESSGIPEYSKLINNGVVPEQLTTGAISFHETPVHQIEQKCMELFLKAPESSRVMAPTRKMVGDINKRIQNAINPNGQPMEFELYGDKMWLDIRLNDQILFTQNFYDKGIQNGSLGKLVSVENSDGIFGVAELDTGEQVEINQTILDSIELGYAITLHKAQGSQFPIVIVALKSGRITDRAWLYTAITRAENEIHIVGSEKDFSDITKAPSKSHQRNSWLASLLSTIKNNLN
tara:strand:- start:9823 stop:11988 length:2166 start_codon:yes stop_codon:yes gene_type:complete